MSKSENDNKLESHVRSLKKALADAKTKPQIAWMSLSI